MKLPHKHSKGELNMSKPIIQLNEENVKSELKELVRSSVEETLNELLNKEADADERGGAQETLLGRALKFGFVEEYDYAGVSPLHPTRNFFENLLAPLRGGARC